MTRRTVPWASVYRNVAEKYGWTWQTINEMTMYQVLVAAGAWCPEDIFEKRPGGV